MRKIIHLDMDCFYASVEMRERPELAGRPIAVGGGSPRGVVTTCNYEARRYGVRSAMPGFQARELCPQLVFLPVRFDLYRAESARIRRLMLEITPLVEPLSLDEAYLDVTACGGFAWKIARELRRKIFLETQLTASAGVAPNKMLAKIASDWRKPNGQFAITPDQVAAFMRALPVRQVPGIGPKSAARFAAAGIATCADLQRFSLAEMAARHGRWGEELFHLCRGEDNRPVEPNRPRKSLSNERTFAENMRSLEACRRALDELIAELGADVAAKARGRTIRTVFVKMKFDDFARVTREQSASAIDHEAFHGLVARAWDAGHGRSVRLLGAGVRFAESDTGEDPQPTLAFFAA